jgi:hypothetical protein
MDLEAESQTPKYTDEAYKLAGLAIALATGKFALRALAQSNVREVGPKGIHVFHVIIDGSIDDIPLGETREVKPGRSTHCDCACCRTSRRSAI